MTDVYWLEQTERDAPREVDWLSPSEAVTLNGMRFAKRRADWRLGRWTAKRAVALCLNLPGHSQALAEIEIRPAPSGAPEVFIANRPAAAAISISHRGGVAACAVVLSGALSQTMLGCDLELIEPHSDAFIADYFTTEEQALVARVVSSDRWKTCALIWSGKESALKALGTGLRLDTRSVVVTPASAPGAAGEGGGDSDIWRPLHVRSIDGEDFHGWWNSTGDLVRTVVASPAPRAPILLPPRGSQPREAD
ncbi:MAG TPA: 4'-phosphopantetheinyl transferase superfamily protein [Candidatus Acidoferrales bacterium]|jgi:4'-phosphopantetheinyl transferase|nr:4'-phosphopantetheinyl transferase superfamily protein [Candidatus Acidoferrales bacterium]